jgi:hypothetical protein
MARNFDACFDALDLCQKRRLFTADEDELLCRIMVEQPFSTWVTVASQLPGRSARQCRDRWANYLCPDNKNAPWTDSEDKLLMAKYQELGPRWTTISKSFDGRSENNVKNRWYTYVRRRMPARREEPVREKFPPIESLGPPFAMRPIFSPEPNTQTISTPGLHPLFPCFI